MRHLGGCLIPGRLIVPAWYPALVTGEGGVVGDLFDVPDDLIPMLDEFEGAHDTPDGLYVRTRQTLIEPAITAWVYLWNGDPGAGPEVPTGDWNDWTMDL